MKRYFRVYRAYAKMSLEALFAYRANFINSSISSVAWGVFSFVSIFLLTSKTSTIYGWKREEIIILTCGYQIMIGVFHTLFSKNFGYMAEVIEYAQLDGFLLKPIDSQFVMSMRWVNYTSIFRIFIGLIFLLYILQNFSIGLDPFITGIFFLLLLVGLLLLYSVWFTVATVLIWFPRLSNIIELMFNVSGMTRYPGELYKHASEYLFLFLLPITLVVATPVKFLFRRTSIFDISELFLVAIIFFISSRKFWKFALRFYTSASS